jgi:hypothetical protein
MNNQSADAKNVPKNKSKFVDQVRQAIQLALDESGWARKPKFATVSQGPQLKGESGVRWTPDIVVADRKFDDLHSVIFCIDDAMSQSQMATHLDRAYVCYWDLCKIRSWYVLVQQDVKSLGDYAALVKDSHARVVEWNPTSATDLARQILSDIRIEYFWVKGIKSIHSTLTALEQRSPDLFGKRTAPPPRTKVLELLRQAKEQDPYMSFGQILSQAIRPCSNSRSSTHVGLFLADGSDKKLEGMLKEYLKRQK